MGLILSSRVLFFVYRVFSLNICLYLYICVCLFSCVCVYASCVGCTYLCVCLYYCVCAYTYLNLKYEAQTALFKDPVHTAQ